MFKHNIIFYFGLSCLSLILFFSCSKNDPNSYELTGKLDNVTDGLFYMTYEIGDSLVIDTISVNPEGEFKFKGKIDTLTEVSLYFNQNTKSTYVLVDKGWSIEMQGDVLFPDLIAVKGGDVNNDLTAFKTTNKDLLQSRAEILNKAEVGQVGKDSVPVKDYVVELKGLNFELSNIAFNYVKSHPDKIASVMLINNFFKDESSIPRLDESLELLKGKAADFPLTIDLKHFRDKIKMSAVGTTAPNFLLKDLKGKEVQLIDYRGKYVVLSFVSTTCSVCLEEKKDAVAAYNALKKQRKDIDFLSIVKDVEEAPITDSITSVVKWTLLPVNGGWGAKTFDDYYIREIPYNILISPNGIILERDIPFVILVKRLEELIPKEVKK